MKHDWCCPGNNSVEGNLLVVVETDMETSLSDENRGISHFKSRHSQDDILISFLLRDAVSVF